MGEEDPCRKHGWWGGVGGGGLIMVVVSLDTGTTANRSTCRPTRTVTTSP